MTTREIIWICDPALSVSFLDVNHQPLFGGSIDKLRSFNKIAVDSHIWDLKVIHTELNYDLRFHHYVLCVVIGDEK